MKFKSRPLQAVTPMPLPAPQPPAPVVQVDNAEVAEVLARQNDQFIKLNQCLAQLADSMQPGVMTVTVTEWTDKGRIKTIKITKEK